MTVSIFKDVQKRLVGALLQDAESEVSQKIGPGLLKHGEVKRLGAHEYVFRVTKCRLLPSGFSTLVLAMNATSAKAHGWMELMESFPQRKKVVNK